MRRVLIPLLVSCALLRAQAAEPEPPEKVEKKIPFKQFPTLPDVIYYENFQAEKSFFLSANPTADGKIEANPAPLYPGVTDMVFKGGLPPWGAAKKQVMATLDLTMIRDAKLPDKTPCNLLYIAMNIYCDDSGDIEFRMTDGVSNWNEIRKAPKVKGWAPVTIPFTDFKAANKPVKAGSVFGKFHIIFTPKDVTKQPTLMVDDVIITMNQKPDSLLGQVRAFARQEADVMRTQNTHGFEYSTKTQELLEKSFTAKARNKKIVLVVASKAADAQTVCAQMTAAAAKAKVQGMTFQVAALPDGTPYNGIDDVRMFLPYSINKTNAGMMLVVLGMGEAFGSVHTSKYLDTAVDRALSLGCVPVFAGPVGGPTIGDKKARLDSFIVQTRNLCITRGTAWVDPAFALKKETTGFGTDGELNNAGLEKLSALTFIALKHVHDNFSFK